MVSIFLNAAFAENRSLADLPKSGDLRKLKKQAGHCCPACFARL
jgi:hypothetical protein